MCINMHTCVCTHVYVHILHTYALSMCAFSMCINMHTCVSTHVYAHILHTYALSMYACIIYIQYGIFVISQNSNR